MSTKNERREPHMTSSDTTSPILITGATGRHGRTGAHLARRLREAGRSVRALVRRLDERTSPLQALGAEIVVGDLHARASLVPALEGVGLAYFTYPVNGGIVQAAANFAAAARQVGGRPRVVVMSVGVSHPESPSHLGRGQWLAEEVLGWAGLDLIILRIASLFYENVPTAHGRSIRDEGMIRNCFGDARLTWISGEDAAEIGLVALLHPERFERGRVQYPPGAELLSHDEVARVLSEELSRPIRFESITREAWRDELLALAEAQPGGAVNPDMAGHISTLGAAAAAPGKGPSRTADAAALQRLTGRAPISFRQFIRAHASQFRNKLATTEDCS